MKTAAPIRLAVVGAGHWGPNLIRTFDNRPVSVVRAVCDVDRARLDQVAAKFPHVPVTDRFDSVLADPEIDAVVIATPTRSHYALVKAALLAGKHVLVEKPIATRTTDAAELTDLADRERLILMVGHVFLFNEAVRRVRAYLEAGELGRIYFISMVRTNLGPIRTLSSRRCAIRRGSS
jgi:predicted dehydrogenase